MTVFSCREENKRSMSANDENPIGIMSVIGTDSREQITNTTSYPYRTIVYIEVTFENGSGASCSGWLYDDNTVATAGHCVYDQTEGWITSATVDPGRNGNDLPYGRAYATSAHSIAGWVNEGLEAYDFGALKLDRSIGNTTGTMGMRVEDTTFSYLGESVAVTGYPGDKHDQGYYYSMWKGLGTVKDEGGQGKMIFYDVDTAAGQSGAPVYQSSYKCKTSTGYCASAIHTYGTGYHGTYNGGTRLNSFYASYFNYWKDN